MAKVRLLQGKPLVVGGKVALSDNCCCTPPSCPSITLICDQISASKTKCGFSEFTGGGAGKIWLTKTVVNSFTFSFPNSYTACNGAHVTVAGSMSSTDVYTVDPDTCEVTCSRSGSGSSTDTALTTPPVIIHDCSYTRNDGSGSDCTPPYQGTGEVCGTSYQCDGTPIGTDCGGSADTFVEGEYLPFGCGGDSGNTVSLTPTVKTITYTTSGMSGSAVVTLSDENTEDICAAALAALPPYDDDFNDPCSASFDHSEASCTISRFKPKFTIPEAIGGNLIICYNEHFVPDVGDPVDTPKTATILPGHTEIIGDEVLEPDEDGEITIQFLGDSCHNPDTCPP